MDKRNAVIEAATARLRPILMTSLAMSLGALPIALSLGAAATSRIPLGIVIVGGILFSLVLTLFVIPVMYVFLSRKKHKNQLEIMDETSSQRA
jgi:multidrug efflux pump